MTTPDIDLDKIISQEMDREAKRKEYNERPDVKEKRKAYNQRRQAEIKIARAVMSDEMTKIEGEAALAVLRGTATPEVPTEEEDSE